MLACATPSRLPSTACGWRSWPRSSRPRKEETRPGDLPHTVSGYLTKPEPRRVTADQTEQLPQRSRELIRSAVDEYEAQHSAEALCAKDADKLEMLLQAVEYRDIGVHRVEGWIDSARKS